ncbi:MAG: phage tail protein, partial [Salinisphaera sp.]|nr:phage tail protein [Salinisphaera sp.]
YDADGDKAVRTVSLTEAGSVSLDFVAPAGLVQFEDDGEKQKVTIAFLVEAAVSGSGTYNKISGLTGFGAAASGDVKLIDQFYTGYIVPPPGPSSGFLQWVRYEDWVNSGGYTPSNYTSIDASLAFKGRNTDTLRGALTFPLGGGDWDIRITRVDSQATDEDADQNRDGINAPKWAGLPSEPNAKTFDSITLTALRTIIAGAPISQAVDGLALLAIRIRATDQLRGTIDRINCVVTSILPTWDGSAWVEQPTSVPAYVYRDILTGPSNPRPLPASRLYDPALVQWAAATQAAGLAFNAPIDPATVFQALQNVAAVGRAAFGMTDGLYSVVRDVSQSTPRQLFTPVNSWDFSAARPFVELPHALRVKYIDPSADWQEAERIVYDDGYDAATASRYEELRLLGVTSKDEAYKHGRYTMAVGRLRPEEYTLTADGEVAACERGDLVHIQHDAIAVGLGAGRLSAVTTDGSGNVTGVTLDQTVAMTAGTNYALRLRADDGAQTYGQVVTANGEHAALTFVSPLASAVQEGDLWAFGVLDKVTLPALVKDIRGIGPDLWARITAVPYHEAIYTADGGVIPDFDPLITLPKDPQARPPPPPVIESVRSDEFVAHRATDETLTYRMTVAFSVPDGAPAAEFVQVQIKEDFTHTWQTESAEAALGQVAFLGVRPLQIYDIRARSLSEQGVASAWVSTQHQVTGVESVPALTGLSATPGLGTVSLSWDPLPAIVSYVEVLSGTTGILGDAVAIGRAPAPPVVHQVPDGGQHYYWARAVIGQVGGAIAGPIIAAPLQTSDYVAHVIEGLLDETHLDETLATRIDLIDGPDTLLGSVNARVELLRDRADAIDLV